MYAVVETVGSRALIPVARVKEIVRLVAFAPLPNAPRHVRGTFLCRGQRVIAVDLASWLGIDREPHLDAHILVFAGALSFGLIVDGVRSLVETPVLLNENEGELPAIWRSSRLTAGRCRYEGEVLPLVTLAPIDQLLSGVSG
jgi:chemotaxis signal transduction protein